MTQWHCTYLESPSEGLEFVSEIQYLPNMGKAHGSILSITKGEKKPWGRKEMGFFFNTWEGGKF